MPLLHHASHECQYTIKHSELDYQNAARNATSCIIVEPEYIIKDYAYRCFINKNASW